MTCYFRHLDDFFAEIGIEITKENKLEIDTAIHEIVGVEYKNCSKAWKLVKTIIAQDRANFIQALRSKLSNS